MGNAKEIVTDIIQGDESLEDNKFFLELTFSDLQKGLNAILQNSNLSESEKLYYIENSWRIHYRKKPPSIEEFLSVKYLGPTAESLYSYIKESLIDFWALDKPYRHACLVPHIGWGKSFFSVLCNLFLVTHLVYMRNPKKFFGLSPATILTQVLISFSLSKASELLLEPFMNILESASMFEKCVKIDTLKNKNREDKDVSKIYWTTAAPTSAIEFSNGVNIKLASSPTKLLGATIIMGTMSELSFFQGRGFSQDYIFRIFTKLKSRIYSRFDTNYWARSLLDSSPDDIDNKIDGYVWKEAHKDPSNFITKGAEWEWKREKYKNPDLVFPIFKGSSGKPPRIITKHEADQLNSDEVLWAPEETRDFFEDDLIETLKDLGGVPAGTPNKLIYNKEKIEQMFSDSLKNIYTCIYASHNDPPEGLIWNLIKDQFFIKIKEDTYEFWRNPNDLRFISVDQSITGDSSAISMVHKEINKNGEDIFVVDFTIVIEPNKSRINLDSIKFFIKDLRQKGRLRISAVSFDQFQSETTMQFLKRDGFDAQRLSVDISVEPYLSFVTLLNNNRIKSGKNIYFKNNLKSLIMSKTEKGKQKVDHIIGKLVNSKEDDGKWDTSLLGFYAKDVSDSVVAAIELCQKNNIHPISIWEEKKLERTKIKQNKADLDDILVKLNEKMSLIID